MINKTFIFLLIFSFVYTLSCTKKKQEYTDSELTLLMREMEIEMMEVKEQIKKGEKPNISNIYQKILSSHSTEPQKSASAEFKLYAESFLSALETLEKSNPESLSEKYELMVTTCMNCHRSMCPGPMVRIEKLYLK